MDNNNKPKSKPEDQEVENVQDEYQQKLCDNRPVDTDADTDSYRKGYN